MSRLNDLIETRIAAKKAEREERERLEREEMAAALEQSLREEAQAEVEREVKREQRSEALRTMLERDAERERLEAEGAVWTPEENAANWLKIRNEIKTNRREAQGIANIEVPETLDALAEMMEGASPAALGLRDETEERRESEVEQTKKVIFDMTELLRPEFAKIQKLRDEHKLNIARISAAFIPQEIAQVLGVMREADELRNLLREIEGHFAGADTLLTKFVSEASVLETAAHDRTLNLNAALPRLERDARARVGSGDALEVLIASLPRRISTLYTIINKRVADHPELKRYATFTIDTSLKRGDIHPMQPNVGMMDADFVLGVGVVPPEPRRVGGGATNVSRDDDGRLKFTEPYQTQENDR